MMSNVPQPRDFVTPPRDIERAARLFAVLDRRMSRRASRLWCGVATAAERADYARAWNQSVKVRMSTRTPREMSVDAGRYRVVVGPGFWRVLSK